MSNALQANEDQTIDLLRQHAFKSSQIPMPPPIKAYLEKLLAIGYNKYCIDCKTKVTTHCLVHYGTFVCRDCAVTHRVVFGQASVYAKAVLTSHWDDYQLSSVAEGFGGNEPLF